MRDTLIAAFLAVVFGAAIALAADLFGADFRVIVTGLLLYVVPTGAALIFFTRERGRPTFRRHETADLLTDKYQRGVHGILNAPITTDIEYKTWLNQEGLWTGDLLAAMRERGCTKQEMNEIEVLGTVPLGAYHAEVERNHQLSMVALRLERLKRVTDGLARK